MLRKRFKIRKSIRFIRIYYIRNDDNTVCEQKCKFCGSDFNNRICENTNIYDAATTLKELCTNIDEFGDYKEDFCTVYIPDQTLCF